MKYLLSAILSLAIPLTALAQAVGGSTAAFAVVKLDTHGASETCVATGKGWSVMLGCGHAFETEKDRRTPMSFAYPTPAGWPTAYQHPKQHLVAADARQEVDLSLVLVEFGPLPYVCPIAPAGHRPTSNLLSVGYDGMAQYSVKAPASFVQLTTFWTREHPSPGRSGGALIDVGAGGLLIGVCQGYEVLPGKRPGRGMYVDHQTILRFLKANRYDWLVGGVAGSPQEQAPASRRLEIPKQFWLENKSGSSCAWTATETLCLWNGLTRVQGLASRHPNSTGPGGPEGELSRLKVNYWSQPYGSTSVMQAKYAVLKGWGCVVGLKKKHCVVLIGYDETNMIVLDNSPPEIRTIPWSAFDGWVIVIYGDNVGGPFQAKPALPTPRPIQVPCPT